jgi:hypothetical protein
VLTLLKHVFLCRPRSAADADGAVSTVQFCTSGLTNFHSSSGPTDHSSLTHPGWSIGFAVVFALIPSKKSARTIDDVFEKRVSDESGIEICSLVFCPLNNHVFKHGI